MNIRLVCLYEKGVRRPREDCRADPGVFGTLIIDDWVVGNAEHRPLKTAKVWHWYESYSRRIVAGPLFDVVLLKVTSKGMLLHGVEIKRQDGRDELVHYTQEWWCEPVSELPPQRY